MRIINVFIFLLCSLSLFAQDPAHLGELWVDGDCVSTNCLDDEEKTQIENTLQSFKNFHGLNVNILVYPKDCRIIENTNGGCDYVNGPVFNNNCTWFDSDVDYLIVIRPGSFRVITNKDILVFGDINLSTNNTIFQPIQDIINDLDLYVNYSQKLLCIVSNALSIIASHENISNNNISSLCEPGGNQVGPPLVQSLMGADMFTQEKLAERFYLNYCTPVLILDGWAVASFVFDEYFWKNKWEEDWPVDEYILIYFKKNGTGYEDVIVEVINNDVNTNIAPFNKCPIQSNGLSDQDLLSIKNEILSKSENLSLAKLDEGVNSGLDLLEHYLLGGVMPRPANVDCQDCNSTVEDTNWAFCVPVNDLSADFLPDVFSKQNGITQVAPNVQPLENENEGILDFSGLPETEKDKLKTAVQRANSLFNTDIKFIYSTTRQKQPDIADITTSSCNLTQYTLLLPSQLLPALINEEYLNNPGEIDTAPYNAAYSYVNEQISNGITEDIVYWINYDEVKEEVCFRFMFKDGFFQPADQAEEQKELYMDAVKRSVITSYDKFKVVDNIDIPITTEEADDHIWDFGVRIGQDNNLTFWSIAGELGGMTKDLLTDGEMDTIIWRYSNPCNGCITQPLFDMPGALAGAVEVLASENPIGNVTQGLTFIYDLTTDQEIRQGIWQAVREPSKLVQAILEENVEIFTSTDTDLKYKTGVKLGGSTIFAIVGGGILFDLLAPNGPKKNASDIADRLREVTEENFPETLGPVSNGAIKFSDRINNKIPDETLKIDFFAFLGELPAGATKIFGHHPQFLDIWHKIKTTNPPLAPTVMDMDQFKFAMSRFPDPTTNPHVAAFYERFTEDFELNDLNVADGAIDKAQEFIKDVGDSSPNSDFLNTFIDNPDVFNAWNEALTRNLPDTWRTNPDFLKPFAKALDEKPKIDLHLTGHINGSGNAVGCHLASAIDNVKIRLRSPQPNGLPTYYPDGTLKKAAVDIKAGSGNWIPKNANSSFFPDGWTNDKVLNEIAYVRSQTANQINDRKWRGLASDGVTEIEVRYTGPLDDLTFDTAFPIL